MDEKEIKKKLTLHIDKPQTIILSKAFDDIFKNLFNNIKSGKYKIVEDCINSDENYYIKIDEYDESVGVKCDNKLE